MKLILLRHGHTFGPDQTGGQCERMLGCHNDLPLVARGREYAIAFADYVLRNNIKLAAIYTNHLQRTKTHAELVQAELQKHQQEIPIIQNEALLELDYGNWAGLKSSGTTAETNEVIAQFGEKAWLAWQERREIPNHEPHNWQVTADEIVTQLHGFITLLQKNHAADETILALGSQGSISFIHALLPGGMEKAIQAGNQKIKPGHFCELQINNDTLELLSWNCSPIS